MLPTDAQERKRIPVYSGFICYFPYAIVEVAKVSYRGNEQHNPGSPLHWDRTKSGDELDALTRHLLDSTFPQSLDDKIEEAAARTWRSLADLEKLCEQRADRDEILADAEIPSHAQEDVHEFMRKRRLVDDDRDLSTSEYIEKHTVNDRGDR